MNISKTFSSPMTLEGILGALNSSFPEITWEMRESHHEGDYIQGAASGLAIRIYDWNNAPSSPVKGFQISLKASLSQGSLPARILSALNASGIADAEFYFE
ncbi:MAG TPA: hypothetical protein VLD37_03360 [Candidatus Bilamarchaeum sp.]|nr:hypothetical protein [Candidatus Bilamarchaeum sp.]